jgi:hypothetical protein
MRKCGSSARSGCRTLRSGTWLAASAGVHRQVSTRSSRCSSSVACGLYPTYRSLCGSLKRSSEVCAGATDRRPGRTACLRKLSTSVPHSSIGCSPGDGHTNSRGSSYGPGTVSPYCRMWRSSSGRKRCKCAEESFFSCMVVRAFPLLFLLLMHACMQNVLRTAKEWMTLRAACTAATPGRTSPWMRATWCSSRRHKMRRYGSRGSAPGTWPGMSMSLSVSGQCVSEPLPRRRTARTCRTLACSSERNLQGTAAVTWRRRGGDVHPAVHDSGCDAKPAVPRLRHALEHCALSACSAMSAARASARTAPPVSRRRAGCTHCSCCTGLLPARAACAALCAVLAAHMHACRSC